MKKKNALTSNKNKINQWDCIKKLQLNGVSGS